MLQRKTSGLKSTNQNPVREPIIKIPPSLQHLTAQVLMRVFQGVSKQLISLHVMKCCLKKEMASVGYHT